MKVGDAFVALAFHVHDPPTRRAHNSRNPARLAVVQNTFAPGRLSPHFAAQDSNSQDLLST